MFFARKQLVVYVYKLCARGELCVRCTSFARKRLIAYVVRLLRSRQVIAYVVHIFALEANYVTGSESPIVRSEIV